MKGFDRRWLACGAVVFGFGVASLGCSGGSTGKGGPLPPPASATTTPVTEAETTEVLKTSTLLATSAVLPFQASLSEIDPTGFPSSVSGSGNITITGDSNSGSVVFDFGSSGLTGQISASYSGGGSAGTVVTTFSNFGATIGSDTLTIDGVLTLTFSHSGGNATGTLSGTVSMTVNAQTTTVVINQAVDYDGSQNQFVISGTCTVTSSAHGAWTATYAGVVYDGDQGEVTQGTVTLVQSNPPATAIYVFNGGDSGTFTITPLGLAGSFTIS